jgi:DegV family protein with EDD domain
MTVAIVADSGSDLTPAQLRDTGIRQVPLSVTFGEQTYLSPDEMGPDAFWERLLAPDSPFPHTAAPSIGLFKQAFEKAFADGHDEVVCVCLSEGLSAAIKHARMAREMLPEKRIVIVDSRSASMAIGALAWRGVALAASGLPAAEIEARLSAMRDGMSLYVGLDTLEYLRKGGRISSAKAAIGGLLSIKPIITVVDGLATERVIELMTDRPVTELHLLYSPPQDPEVFKAAILARMPGPAPKVVTAQIIGPVIGAHIGPGAYGGIMVRED